MEWIPLSKIKFYVLYTHINLTRATSAKNLKEPFDFIFMHFGPHNQEHDVDMVRPALEPKILVWNEAWVRFVPSYFKYDRGKIKALNPKE